MDDLTKTRILAGLTEAAVVIHETSKRFGYWDKDRSDFEFVDVVRSELMTISTLVHKNETKQESPVMPEYSKLEEELSDIIIRVLDFARGRGLSIGPALIEKMEYNEALAKIGKGY